MAKGRTDWNRHTIKAALGLRGKTLTSVAETHGLDLSRVSRGITGADRAGAEAVAIELGIPFKELFPGLYVNKSRGRRSVEVRRKFA